MWQWINMLTWWQWLILGAVPPAIIALYFLKLKRRPLEVPSTYLWHRSIEDLHVNTVWQRLRRNLLLFLQLLLVLLAMLAVLRPGWRGSKMTGTCFIFLIDNSASMQATDTGRSRLEEAKRQAREVIDKMTARDVGMIVSFADNARVKQMFSHSRGRLRRALDSIQPTFRPTSLAEALQVAAARANPGHSANPEDAQDSDILVAEAVPATLYIFSDGKFPHVADFRLGNLEPVYMPIGTPEAANVGILAFNARRSVSDPTLWQAFARLKNFGPKDVVVSLVLRLDGRVIDAAELSVESGKAAAVPFPVETVESGVLQLEITNADDLACDNVAWTIVNPPRRSSVLVVTPGNKMLELGFGTTTVSEIADVTIESPGFLDKKEYQQQAAVGAYDLVIYDRCQPKTMPQANTLFVGALPPAKGNAEAGDQDRTAAEADPPEGSTAWKAGPRADVPVIIDTNSAHPIMQWIDLGRVRLASGTPLEVPSGGTVLVRSHVGPMFVIAPRESFEDAVMGFALVEESAGQDGKVETDYNTDWPVWGSFPVFVLNLLDYFGEGRAAAERARLRPGQTATLESPTPDLPLEVLTPSGARTKLEKARAGRFKFTDTSELGAYQVRSAGKTTQHFAVNMFHAMESDVATAPDVKIGRGLPIQAPSSSWETTRRELWKTLLLAGLAVLCFEWYVYNRRVYL